MRLLFLTTALEKWTFGFELVALDQSSHIWSECSLDVEDVSAPCKDDSRRTDRSGFKNLELTLVAIYIAFTNHLDLHSEDISVGVELENLCSGLSILMLRGLGGADFENGPRHYVTQGPT